MVETGHDLEWAANVGVPATCVRGKGTESRDHLGERGKDNRLAERKEVGWEGLRDEEALAEDPLRYWMCWAKGVEVEGDYEVLDLNAS